MTDEAEDATCEKPGKTSGSHCSVCGKVFESQEEIEASPHTEVEVVTKAATCTEPGNAMVFCSTCHKILTDKKEIPATGHDPITVDPVVPTCTEDGKTEGIHCSVCGEVLEEQKIIPATGHNWEAGEIVKEATCTEEGEQSYTCTNCEKTRTEKLPMIEHQEVTDEAVAATCEESGKTEGSHCAVCGKVLRVQKETPSLGHKEVIDKAIEATCETAGKTEGSHCKICDKILKAQKEIPAQGHKEAEMVTKAAT